MRACVRLLEYAAANRSNGTDCVQGTVACGPNAGIEAHAKTRGAARHIYCAPPLVNAGGCEVKLQQMDEWLCTRTPGCRGHTPVILLPTAPDGSGRRGVQRTVLLRNHTKRLIKLINNLRKSGLFFAQHCHDQNSTYKIIKNTNSRYGSGGEPSPVPKQVECKCKLHSQSVCAARTHMMSAAARDIVRARGGMVVEGRGGGGDAACSCISSEWFKSTLQRSLRAYCC